MHIYLGGTFDAFHPGHLTLIKAARHLAGTFEPISPKRNHVTVAINSDAFVERYKGRKPRVSYLDRFAMLVANRYVDSVRCNTGDEDSRPAIEAAGPDIILAGADWATPDGEKYLAQLGLGQAWLDERGIMVLFLPRAGGWASSATPKPACTGGVVISNRLR